MTIEEGNDIEEGNGIEEGNDIEEGNGIVEGSDIEEDCAIKNRVDETNVPSSYLEDSWILI